MYKQRDTYVPRKHHVGYRDRGNWGTSKTRNIHREVHSFAIFIYTKHNTLVLVGVNFCGLDCDFSILIIIFIT